MMIQCRRSGKYCCKTSALCSFLSQCHLLEQLKTSNDKKHGIPKTFPVEFRTASSPPVHRDKNRERCDQAVLEALARANQKALKIGDPLVPFSKHYTIYKSGSLVDVKRAGCDLAEQFIMKYPESFKIRWSDKMSIGKLTYVEEICRDKKLMKAKEIFERLENGDETCLEDTKKDLDAILDLFAFYNASPDESSLPMKYDKDRMVHRYEKAGKTHDLPYSKSLFKTLEVEYRNFLLVLRDLLSADCCPNLEAATKLQLLQGYISDDRGETRNAIMRYTLIPSLKPQPIGIDVSKTTEGDEKEGEEEKRHHFEDKAMEMSLHEFCDYAPPVSDLQHVNIMEGTALSLRALEFAKLYEIVSAGNYDCVIQSAVKFYRPDLAWDLYLEMRDAGFHPNADTITDLIYSMTHEMTAAQFVENGAVKIKKILSDLSENPVALVTDDMFLNLFYGTHLAPGGHEDKITADIRSAVDRYNYNVLNEMISCLESGMFKLRFSTAYKILELNNLRVGDEPKSKYTVDLNNLMFDVYNDHPEHFIRDLENDECTGFIALLLRYAREYHPLYNIDAFYVRHREDLLAISNAYDVSGSDMMIHVNDLRNILVFDLANKRGLKLPEHSFDSIDKIREVTVFDFYKDFYKNNLDRLPVTHGINMMEELFKMIRCLDPYTTDVPYMLGIYKEIIQETIRITKECKVIRSAKDTGTNWTVALFTFLEEFYNKLNIEYLIKFSLSEENMQDTFQTKDLLEQARKMVLTEANILDIIKMTSDSISLLLNNGGVPTTVMVYILISYTLKSGEYKAAWELLEMYNYYSIPLESAALLKYIELTPAWETEGEAYLENIGEPLQASVRSQVKELEKRYRQDIISLSKLQRYHRPFSTTDNRRKDRAHMSVEKMYRDIST